MYALRFASLAKPRNGQAPQVGGDMRERKRERERAIVFPNKNFSVFNSEK
jgi:hypothetical protein